MIWTPFGWWGVQPGEVPPSTNPNNNPDPGATSPVPVVAPPTHDAQYTTIFEAATVAAILNANGFPVADFTDDPNTSGLFIPQWAPGPNVSDPTNKGSRKWYQLRFKNGKTENAGLIAGMMAAWPTCWQSVFKVEYNS